MLPFFCCWGGVPYYTFRSPVHTHLARSFGSLSPRFFQVRKVFRLRGVGVGGGGCGERGLGFRGLFPSGGTLKNMSSPRLHVRISWSPTSQEHVPHAVFPNATHTDCSLCLQLQSMHVPALLSCWQVRQSHFARYMIHN